MPQGQEHSWPERVNHLTMRVHHTKCTITHTHVGKYIYIYTHIHHAQCYHTEQESKTNIAIPRERGLSKEQEKIKGTRGGGTLIHALEKRLRERERENHSGGAGPPNLLNIAPWWACIFLLASLPISLAPRRSCPRSKCPSSMHVRATSKETSQQSSKEKNRRKAC